MTTMDRIAAAMGCAPADDDDLVEAVRLLVAERDAAVAARDALAGAVREEREARKAREAAMVAEHYARVLEVSAVVSLVALGHSVQSTGVTRAHERAIASVTAALAAAGGV